jgi:hypothetical protein
VKTGALRCGGIVRNLLWFLPIPVVGGLVLRVVIHFWPKGDANGKIPTGEGQLAWAVYLRTSLPQENQPQQDSTKKSLLVPEPTDVEKEFAKNFTGLNNK